MRLKPNTQYPDLFSEEIHCEVLSVEMEIHKLHDALARVDLSLTLLRYRERRRRGDKARIPGPVLHLSGSRNLPRTQKL